MADLEFFYRDVALYSLLPASAGALCLFLFGLRQGHFRAHYFRKLFVEMFGGTFLGVFVGQAMPTRSLEVLISFLLGLTWVLTFQTLRRWTDQILGSAVDWSVQALKDAKQEAKERPNEVRPVWEVSQLRLEQYIARNQAQVAPIFWVTILVILAGFMLISFGLFTAFNSHRFDAAAVLATAAGTISQFIGATFLYVYKSTIDEASSYMQTLERINAVGMAVKILDSIPEENVEIKNRARADLAVQILQNSKASAPSKAGKKKGQ